jgi:hypothetical protein
MAKRPGKSTGRQRGSPPAKNASSSELTRRKLLKAIGKLRREIADLRQKLAERPPGPRPAPAPDPRVVDAVRRIQDSLIVPRPSVLPNAGGGRPYNANQSTETRDIDREETHV